MKSLVILNVPESETEDAEAKANAVGREGLKLKNVKFSAVELKRSRFAIDRLTEIIGLPMVLLTETGKM